MGKLKEALDAGLVDEDIIDVLDLINALPFAYTTSSCSGRIMLIDIPPSEKKYESNRIARWHSVIDFDTFWKTITNYKPRGTLWLKVDSFIVAFAVNSIDWAAYFLKLARFLGLKYSGVRSINLKADHIILDIASTEHVHLPLSDNERGLLITEEYGRYVHKIATHKLKKTKERLNRFRNALKILNELYKKDQLDPKEENFKPYAKVLE